MLTTRVDEDRKQHIKANGLECLSRLHGDQSWEDWMGVGEALEVITEEALAAVGAKVWDKDNKQAVKEFNRRWEAYEASAGKNYEPLSKQERSSLREVRSNPAIIAYRFSLDGPDKRRLNHPHSVIKRWKAYQAQERAKATPKPPPRQEPPKAAPASQAAKAEPLTDPERRKLEGELEKVRQELKFARTDADMLRQGMKTLKRELAAVKAAGPKPPLDPESEAARQIKGLVTKNRNLNAKVQRLSAALTAKGYDDDEIGSATFSVRGKLSKALTETTTDAASRHAALQALNGLGANNKKR